MSEAMETSRLIGTRLPNPKPDRYSCLLIMEIFHARPPAFPTQTLAPESFTIPLLRPEKWMEEASEGELSVDVYESDGHFVVQSAIAGVLPEDLSLAIHRDLLTIRGERTSCAPHRDRSYLVEECFWGRFSRSILLPEPVDVPRAEATLQHGVLTIVLPKLVERTDIAVEYKNEN